MDHETMTIHGGVQGRLTRVERLHNTPSGNPMWALHFGPFIYRTKADTACAHLISEHDEGREVVVRFDEDGFVIFYDTPYTSRCDVCGELITRCVGH